VSFTWQRDGVFHPVLYRSVFSSSCKTEISARPKGTRGQILGLAANVLWFCKNAKPTVLRHEGGAVYSSYEHDLVGNTTSEYG
jgi:hypothetical protein